MDKPKTDKARILFHGRAISIAIEKFSASCDGREAEPFIDFLYEKYKAEGSQDVTRWLSTELGKHFRYVTKPPRWVESEPSWPYANGRPMVFVCQYGMPDNAVTRESVTWGVELYLFGARTPCEGGYRTEYRVVEQEEGIDGEGD